MKCNYCEHKKVKFNGRNNHYVVCGRTDGFVGYCKRGTTALYDEAPLPDWCPTEAEAEAIKLKAMLSAAVDTIEKIPMRRQMYALWERTAARAVILFSAVPADGSMRAQQGKC